MSAETQALLASVGLAGDWAWAAFLVFVRTAAVIAVMPAFGETVVPMRIRLSVALAFAAVVIPVVGEGPWPEPGVGAVLAEAAAGLVIGLGLRFLVHALQIAGTIAAQSIALTQLFGGTAGEPQPAVANLLVLAGLALAVSTGLHVAAARLLVQSYDLWPAGVPPAPGAVAAVGLAQAAQAFGLAFSLAAPFAAAALLYNVALGVINRAMPTLMVSFVGAPALTLGAFVLLAVATPLLLSVWTEALRAQLADPLRLP